MGISQKRPKKKPIKKKKKKAYCRDSHYLNRVSTRLGEGKEEAGSGGRA